MGHMRGEGGGEGGAEGGAAHGAGWARAARGRPASAVPAPRTQLTSLDSWAFPSSVGSWLCVRLFLTSLGLADGRAACKALGLVFESLDRRERKDAPRGETWKKQGGPLGVGREPRLGPRQWH